VDTSPRHYILFVAGFAVILLVCGLTLRGNQLSLIQAGLIMASLGISFQIVFGLLGQLSLGHSALFGIGAYTFAWLALHDVPPLLAIVASALFGLVSGVVVASITARLGGAYFAVVTYALASVIAVIVSATETLGMNEGLIGVPSLRLFNLLSRAAEQLLYAGLVFLLIQSAFYVLWRSQLGSMLEAVRSNTLLAQSLGINVPLATIVATGISGLLAGLVGGIFAQGARFVSPDVFHLYYIVTPLAAVAIGGPRALFGALLGVVIVVIIPLELSMSPIMNQVVSGLLLTIFVILFPAGLAGILSRFVRREEPLAPVAQAMDFQMPATDEAGDDRSFRPVVLSVNNVGVRYGGLEAVRDFSMELRRGEVVGLIGANGAGKSSLVNGVTGIVRVSAGEVSVDGVDVSGLPAYKRTRLGLARTFQNTALVETLDVQASVELARGRGSYARALGDGGMADVDAAIAACGLEPLRHRKVASLSYMDRRLTAIAMALAMRPKVIFLDEATAGLTAEERAGVTRLIHSIARSWQTTFLVIEHDVEFVAKTASRIYVMNEGRFLAEGPPDTVLRDPEVVSSYLGSSWNDPEN
jgi:branched-chain amino acid transport system ATP-binding protein